MDFGTSSLMYTGSSFPRQCNENHVSAILRSVACSSFICLCFGDSLLQLSVLLLLIDAPDGLCGVRGSSTSLCFPFCLERIWVRSVEDLECSSFRISLCARSLTGDVNAYGRDSSSIVLPDGRLRVLFNDRFRREIP